jgi:dTDP-4-amino-4,6-dideoxygalactose transaminase
VKTYQGAERGGFYAFPIIHEPQDQAGLSASRFIQALQAEGLKACASPYGLLHRLKIFAEGFDVFTRNRGPLGGDYRGYQQGDFPVTEDVFERLIFLPMLSDPLPEAAEKIAGILRRVCQIVKDFGTLTT